MLKCLEKKDIKKNDHKISPLLNDFKKGHFLCISIEGNYRICYTNPEHGLFLLFYWFTTLLFFDGYFLQHHSDEPLKTFIFLLIRILFGIWVFEYKLNTLVLKEITSLKQYFIYF